MLRGGSDCLLKGELYLSRPRRLKLVEAEGTLKTGDCPGSMSLVHEASDCAISSFNVREDVLATPPGSRPMCLCCLPYGRLRCFSGSCPASRLRAGVHVHAGDKGRRPARVIGS